MCNSCGASLNHFWFCSVSVWMPNQIWHLSTPGEVWQLLYPCSVLCSVCIKERDWCAWASMSHCVVCVGLVVHWSSPSGAVLQEQSFRVSAPLHGSSSLLCLRDVTLYLHNVWGIIVSYDLRVFSKAMAQQVNFVGFIYTQQREKGNWSQACSSCISPADFCLFSASSQFFLNQYDVSHFMLLPCIIRILWA